MTSPVDVRDPRVLDADQIGSGYQPVLVASDGCAQSDAAFTAAMALASPEELRVVGVIEPAPPTIASVVDAAASGALPDRRRALESAIRRQAAAFCPDVEAPAHVRVGNVPDELTAAAADADARLIVVGIGRHRVVDRLLGSETAVRLIRVARVPVLAIARRMMDRPRIVVVGIDLSRTSLRALDESIRMAADHATIYAVAVVPPDESIHARIVSLGDDEVDVERALSAIVGEVDRERGIRIHPLVFRGHPAETLLGLAERAEADLIAVGSHGHGAVTRLITGSVATRLLRASTRNVLVVPHRVTRRRGRGQST